MNFLHTREYLEEGDIVVVECSHQCNVLLTNDTNFSKYKRGEEYECYGGWYKRLPAYIAAPSTGYWNVTLDLAGGSANLRHSFNIIRNR